MPEVNNNEIIWKIAAAMYPNKKTTDSQGFATTNFKGVDRSVVRELLTLLDQFIPKWVKVEEAVFEDCDTMIWIRRKEDELAEPAWIGSMCDHDFVEGYYTHVMKHPYDPLEPTDHPYALLLNHLENNK